MESMARLGNAKIATPFGIYTKYIYTRFAKLVVVFDQNVVSLVG